jgi:hypothetical protein
MPAGGPSPPFGSPPPPRPPLQSRPTQPHIGVGGFWTVRWARASRGPYHLLRELALCEALALRTWRPPSLARVRGGCHAATAVSGPPNLFGAGP